MVSLVYSIYEHDHLHDHLISAIAIIIILILFPKMDLNFSN